jgi:hypothetical protein
MTENVIKREYNKLLFFHGVCFDKKSDHKFYNDLDAELGVNIDLCKVINNKYSRYCIVGEYNYNDNILVLGLSMLEYPHPYFKKKAREIAIENLNSRAEFSIVISFEFLKESLGYELGNEVKTFNQLNQALKSVHRGSLITLFVENRYDRLVSAIETLG